MNFFRIFIIYCLTLGLFAGTSFAVPSTGDAAKTASEIESRLENCAEKTLEVEFLCDPEWKSGKKGNTVFAVISADPAVTLTIHRRASPVVSLLQWDHQQLKDLGKYADGFRTEQVAFAGEEALKVKAFSEEYPQIRLLDYYLIHDGDLYSILFSVEPKENWDDYKFLLQKIAHSFNFIDTIRFLKLNPREESFPPRYSEE